MKLYDIDPRANNLEARVNDLYVNLNEFSKVACLDGRLFGVRTACDQCNLELNACLRNGVLSGLLSAQDIVEEKIGFNLTERWHEQTFDWDGYSNLQGDWPGTKLANVRRQYAAIEGFTPFTLSPYIQTGLVPTDSGSGYCVVELDGTKVDNPEHVLLRDANGSLLTTQVIHNYPRRNGDGDWLVALEKNPAAPACSAVISVQHCFHMYVDVPTPVCTGKVVPVYTGTNQEIPQSKPSQIIGSVTRYWFHVWDLVDPSFTGGVINLHRGEFYKLLPNIEFKCRTDVTAYPVVTWRRYDTALKKYVYTEETLTYGADVTDPYYSVFTVQLPSTCTDKGDPVKVKIYYKTHPSVINREADLLRLQEAISYYVAANLPLASCGCEIKSGFIYEARRAYTEIRINPITGEAIHNLKFGNLTGQLEFAERLASIAPYQKLILT